jgi:hypothetical protein
MLQKIPYWKLMSKGEREHIKAYHRREKAHLSFSRCSLSIEERSHMSLRGERHASRCYVFFVLIFIYPTFSHYPISDSGGERVHIKGKKIFGIHCIYLYSLGTCLCPNRVLSTHSLHVIPVLVLLWFSELALASSVLVLSNPVFSSSPPPKPIQDHKVSICITLICMMISC